MCGAQLPGCGTIEIPGEGMGGLVPRRPGLLKGKGFKPGNELEQLEGIERRQAILRRRGQGDALDRPTIKSRDRFQNKLDRIKRPEDCEGLE